MKKSKTAFAKGLAVSFFSIAIMLSAAPAASVTIQEFLTPTPDSSPADLAFDAKGNLWFTEINGNKIGKLVPSEAKPGTANGIAEYPLPNPDSKPHYIIVARNGIVWFTEMAGRLGRLDPATGIIKEYDTPTSNSEPHGLLEDEDGNIWFLEFESSQAVRLDPATGGMREFPLGKGHPHALVKDGDKIWYTMGGKFWMGKFFNKVGALNIKTGKIMEIAVPPEKSVPHAMIRAGNRTIWFSQLFANKIARIVFTKGGPISFQEFHLGKRVGPHGIAADDARKLIWFTANRMDSIGRLDIQKAAPGTGQGVEFFKIPTAGAHPNEIAVDKEGNVWFTEMGHYFRGQFQNKIGKLIP